MSEENSTISINVSIANKSFPMTVKSQEEEEIYRAASKRIQNMISKFHEKYNGADPLDFLYFTAFQHTVALIREEKKNDTGPILNEIERINIKLDEFIKE